MYYQDLSEFEYHSAYTGLNVGWLDGEHDFPLATPSTEFLDALFAVIESGKFTKCAAAGVHLCELCNSRELVVDRNGGEIFMGNTEIEITSRDMNFIAPSLVYHYVSEHNYSPPEPFIQGVINAAATV